MIIRRYAHRVLKRNDAQPTAFTKDKLYWAARHYWSGVRSGYSTSHFADLWKEAKWLFSSIKDFAFELAFTVVWFAALPLWPIIALIRVWLHWPLLRNHPKDTKQGEG